MSMSTGMRQGEVIGLTWDDVDFEAGTVTIRHALKYTKAGGYVLGEPKTI